MNKIIAFCASLAFLVGVSGGAGATIVPASFGPLDIDFRDGSFSRCNFSPGCTVGGVTVTPTGGLNLLFWAHDDGFGVRDSSFGAFDEIQFGETLTIEFSERYLTGVWFTDMFEDSVTPFERADVELFDGGGSLMTFTYFGEEPNSLNNGGAFGSFGAAFLANKVLFTFSDVAGNDYSVAGLTVPLPGALGLMVSGLAAFVVMARRRRKAAAA